MVPPRLTLLYRFGQVRLMIDLSTRSNSIGHYCELAVVLVSPGAWAQSPGPLVPSPLSPSPPDLRVDPGKSCLAFNTRKKVIYWRPRKCCNTCFRGEWIVQHSITNYLCSFWNFKQALINSCEFQWVSVKSAELGLSWLTTAQWVLTKQVGHGPPKTFFKNHKYHI